MKTTIQKNKTTILAYASINANGDPEDSGYVVCTLTAGNGLSPDLQSHTGQRLSERLVHNKVFKTFRDPRLAKLYFNILDAGEVNTDFWRRPNLLERQQVEVEEANAFWSVLDEGVEEEEATKYQQEDYDSNPEEPVVSEYEKVSYDHDDYWN
jgi:hypothetical protein